MVFLRFEIMLNHIKNTVNVHMLYILLYIYSVLYLYLHNNLF